MSSVERVAARESFSPEEPLPAFTFPVLDEAAKQEVLRRVEASRAASGQAPLRPPAVPPAPEAEQPESPLEASASPVEASASPPEASASPLEPSMPVSAPGPKGPGAGARASALARGWIEAACAVIDRSRSLLPASIRRPLSKVRDEVILAVLVALALTVLVGGFLLISGGDDAEPEPKDSAQAPPPPPKHDPVPREIEQAKKEGHAALEKLAGRFPKDHRVWLELAASHSAKGEHAPAVETVGKALASDPKASEHALASDVLSLAVRKRNTTDAAFELLEGAMGPAGATALYDLSIDPKVELPLRARAEKWIRSEAFQKVAEPDVEIAASLRYGKSCADRHSILPQASEKGGQRTLDFLNMAKNPVGCGRGAKKDCYPCLRKDDALKDAIAAIEKRVGRK